MHATPSEFMEKLFLNCPPAKKCETIVYIPSPRWNFQKSNKKTGSSEIGVEKLEKFYISGESYHQHGEKIIG